ncbi:hypothetical protein FB451DRAFT_1407688 [Mycena latifolia]|nr:hypothetical protein FB451DRAFT_1407688 [Mycena latifolia]
MKILLVFCDGTGMDGSLASPGSTGSDLDRDKFAAVAGSAEAQHDIQTTSESKDFAAVPEVDGGGNTQYATNVLRLARSVRSVDEKGNRQIVFYQSGVGSEANFAGDPVTGTTALQALRTAVASKIRDAYVFVAQNFEDGDQICLFGFSRGAYTARKLSGLIIWRELVDKKTPTIPSDTRRPSIRCVGVWDTVGSVYHQIDALDIVDTSLPATVKTALHAISLQENRQKFLPTLWTIPRGGLRDDQVLKQVWFAGAHSDVGGGYQRHELADISAFWMAGEIKSIVSLDLEFLRSYSQVRPDPWGTSQPHNAYMETPFTLRPVVGNETRLESAQITQQSVFHESIKHSPLDLTSPYHMITMQIIQQKFGPGFAPQYPALNEFEQYCKDRWGKGLEGLLPPGIESPGIVIRPSVQWIPGDPDVLLQDAIVGGNDLGNDMYVSRAPYQGGLHPGKFHKGYMYISYNGKEIEIDEGFEILTGGPSAVRWVPFSGRFSLSQLGGAIPVLGGVEADGHRIYVAQVEISKAGGTHCGKVCVNSYALVPYAGKEVVGESYNVLVFA